MAETERTPQQALQAAIDRDDVDTWGRLCLEANRELAARPDPWQAWQYAVEMAQADKALKADEATSPLRARIIIGRQILAIYKSHCRNSQYRIGQRITTTYNNAPLEPAQQYRIGVEVEVRDTQTQRLLAKFRVEQTDEYQVSGIVTEIF